jgi:hypothetical protein
MGDNNPSNFQNGVGLMLSLYRVHNMWSRGWQGFYNILSCLEGFIADFSAVSAGAAEVSASLCMYPFLCVS